MGQKQTTYQYGFFREDKPALPGHSKELISIANKDNPDNLRGIEYKGCKTIWDLFQTGVKQHPNHKFLGTRNPNKEGRPYEWKTFREAYEIMELLGRGLTALDLCKETEQEGKVWRFLGIHSKNREEWALMNLAAMRQSITILPFYESLGHDGLKYIINQTLLDTLCTEAKNFNNVVNLYLQNTVPTLKTIILFDKPTDEQRSKAHTSGLKLYYFQEIIEFGKQNPEVVFKDPQPETIYMFCYTSGTTGEPKAAMICHSNMIANQTGEQFVAQTDGTILNDTDVSLSYLPYAHVFEQAVFVKSFLNGFCHGYYSGDPLLLMDDVQNLKPTFMPVVPRILMRVYQRIYDGIQTKGKFAQWLFHKAVEEKSKNFLEKGTLTHALYDKLIFQKVKDVFGGRLSQAVSGSAAIDPKIMLFFKISLGFNIQEGYASTETSCVGTITRMVDNTIGHVGGMSPQIKGRLRDVPEMNYYHTDNPPKGEIQLFGPSLFKGYFKNPEQTQAAFSEDGWLNTGDVVAVLPNGAITIIDRAKNIFKLQQGEYIAPEKLQSIYGQLPIISQIFVYGDSSKSYLIAIIVPDMEYVKKWASEKGLSTENIDEILQNQELKNDYIEQLKSKGDQFNVTGLERIKKVHLTKIAFTPENELVTPTMKVKRFNVRKFFEKEIHHLYEEDTQ